MYVNFDNFSNLADAGSIASTLQKKTITCLNDAECSNIIPVANKAMHVCVSHPTGSSCNVSDSFFMIY